MRHSLFCFIVPVKVQNPYCFLKVCECCIPNVRFSLYISRIVKIFQPFFGKIHYYSLMQKSVLRIIDDHSKMTPAVHFV